MVATFWLLGWVLAPAQTPPCPAPTATAIRSDWVLTPRLTRGQELVYRGTYSEEATGARVEFQRGYRFEARYFVLETPPRGADVAAMTALHSRAPRPANAKPDSGAASIRLGRLTVDLQGRINSAAALGVPLEGPPTLEVGGFVEAPRGKLAAQQGWDTADAGRPPLSWRVVGTESVAGQLCAKLVGVQQSDDWDRPRADRSGWRRQETVWVAVRTGIALRVERVIEHHEPARAEVSRRSVLRYELETGLQLPGQMALDRRQEIQQALSFQESAAPLLGEPARNARPLHELQRRIATHLDTPPTPYREAVFQTKRQVDAACKGEVVTTSYQEAPTRAVAVAAPGEPAPDFVAGPITTKDAGRLSKWKGKPVLLVFYHPTSFTAPDLLRFAQHLHVSHGRSVTVVGLPVTDDTAAVLRQRDALNLQFPLYSGGGMRISYGVETTPKVVLIDSVGTIRGMYFGWGRETAEEVMTDLSRWSGLPR
ncbi:MAG: redoxin domain-containing protein [Gemmataceae bacterium]